MAHTAQLTNTSFIRSNDLLGKILHRGKEEKEAMVAEVDKSQEVRMCMSKCAQDVFMSSIVGWLGLQATVPQNH